jgi:hypothetical protein
VVQGCTVYGPEDGIFIDHHWVFDAVIRSVATWIPVSEHPEKHDAGGLSQF